MDAVVKFVVEIRGTEVPPGWHDHVQELLKHEVRLRFGPGQSVERLEVYLGRNVQKVEDMHPYQVPVHVHMVQGGLVSSVMMSPGSSSATLHAHSLLEDGWTSTDEGHRHEWTLAHNSTSVPFPSHDHG